MSFAILFQQTQALAQITQHLGGNVRTTSTRFQLGDLASPILGAQLMLGDALRLVALLEDIEYDTSPDDPLLDYTKPDNSSFMLGIMSKTEELRQHVHLLDEMVEDLEASLRIVMEQLGQLNMITQQVSHLQSALPQESSAFSRAHETLAREVMPHLYRVRDMIQALLLRYRTAADNVRRHLWYIETVFKFVLPQAQALKERRRLALLEDALDISPEELQQKKQASAKNKSQHQPQEKKRSQEKQKTAKDTAQQISQTTPDPKKPA